MAQGVTQEKHTVIVSLGCCLKVIFEGITDYQ